jgi:hypothetical protein
VNAIFVFMPWRRALTNFFSDNHSIGEKGRIDASGLAGHASGFTIQTQRKKKSLVEITNFHEAFLILRKKAKSFLWLSLRPFRLCGSF